MLLLAHTITGAVIGQKIGNPWLVSAIALASHFVLDWIPHWSYDVPNKFDARELVKITPDVMASIIVYLTFLYSFPDQWLTITLGVAFGILPDFMTLTHYVPGVRSIFNRFNAWHGRIQVHDERILGLLSQVVYIGMLIVVLLAVK